MNLSIDSAIFIGFLIANLIFGLCSSGRIKNIKEYAIGNRDFSTATIASTIVATWISGSFFFTIITESYTNGLYFMWAVSGGAVCLLIIGFIYAPRLGEFLGKLSIAEAMGDLYGEKVRIITSIAGFIGACGMIATQLKIAGLTFEYCFGISSLYGVIVSGTIITLYSAFGGIKSVTFTDIIQFFTFGTILPIISYFILTSLDSVDVLTSTLLTNELFDYKKVFDFSQPKSLYYLVLFLYYAIPAFDPAIFQRISMSKNVNQLRRSFVIAGFTCLFLVIIINWISVLVLSTQPELGSNDIVKYILLNYSYVGLNGLTLAGIMAMVMSTADSYVNSTAVLVAHDFCKPLKIDVVKNELLFTRIISLMIGVFAIILSLRSGSLLQLIITTNSFYMPIVTIPFTLTILGFRSSGLSVLIGMTMGLLTVVIWDKILQIQIIDGLIPAMFANLVFLMGSHYLLRQSGGWIGIKDQISLNANKNQRRLSLKRFFNSVINFNPISFFKNNDPKSEGVYVFFGMFCIISIYATMHTISKECQMCYSSIVEFIYPSISFISTLLISYPLWLKSWKQSFVSSILWNFALFYILICVGFFLVIISGFAQLQLMVFMVNLIIISALVKWQLALSMLIAGLLLTTQFFKYYVGVDSLPDNLSTIHFETTYLLLLVSSVLIIFLKPKQEQQELTEEKNDHLNSRISTQEIQVKEALALKGEFIRNVSHEYHAPMTGIISTVETLWESYDKLTEKQRLSAIEIIYKSSNRLHTYDENITSLAKLSKGDYKLVMEQVNISNLLRERIDKCRKLYIEDKDANDFILNIEDTVIINGNAQYLAQAFDNLVINAITYCKKGKIDINLTRDESSARLTVIDEGIGIPPLELIDIFGDFTVSSKTRTPAGGRGIGLALCKKIVEIHNGSIKAESDGKLGATFKVILPL